MMLDMIAVRAGAIVMRISRVAMVASTFGGKLVSLELVEDAAMFIAIDVSLRPIFSYISRTCRTSLASCIITHAKGAYLTNASIALLVKEGVVIIFAVVDGNMQKDQKNERGRQQTSVYVLSAQFIVA
jgi:hypothetical protein